MGGAVNGSERAATEADFARFDALQQLQAQSRVPLLQRSADRDSYVFVALFDGTGQDRADPRQRLTNIGEMARQLEIAEQDASRRLGFTYVEGIGTQSNPLVRLADGAVPSTWDDKLERAYADLVDQAWKWKQQNPDARISLIDAGYSRGGVLAAGFARMVDTYGIADPRDLRFGRDAQGNVTVISPHPPLVPPGEVAQVVGLFDPVATNMPAGFDARLPSGVLAGVSVIAADERRTTFPHQAIIDTGLTADRRFVAGSTPGGHSDAGGGNRNAGLQAMHFNLVADTLNAAVERPLFTPRPLPRELDAYRVSQAGGPTAAFGLALDRDGQRNLRSELANCKVVDPCRDAEPVDTALAARFPWRSVQPGWQVPRLDELQRGQRRAGVDEADTQDAALLGQIRSGVRGVDAQAGKPYDATSEHLARHLLVATREARPPLSQVDHVLLGSDARHLFAVQGALDDPARRRVQVDIGQALSTPVEQAEARVQAAQRAQALSPDLALATPEPPAPRLGFAR